MGQLGGMAGLVSRSLGHSLALTWAGLGLGLDHGRGLELALRGLGRQRNSAGPWGGMLGWIAAPEASAMEVQFREVDPFNCWIWLRFSHPPGAGERNYVEGVFDSWFVLGKLGGFNGENLQAHESGADLSWISWDADQSSQALPALMHNMSAMEYQGEWARCWIDLGTSDPLALDVLVNALDQLDRDVVEIELLLIGGVNEDWPVEDPEDALFASAGAGA